MSFRALSLRASGRIARSKYSNLPKFGFAVYVAHPDPSKDQWS
jgi:hypothetical protein